MYILSIVGYEMKTTRNFTRDMTVYHMRSFTYLHLLKKRSEGVCFSIYQHLAAVVAVAFVFSRHGNFYHEFYIKTMYFQQIKDDT